MTTTLAECPDCGTHYVWIPSAAVFRCGGCKAPDFHELAPADIYVEHDERWHAVLSESDSGYVLAITKREPEPELLAPEEVDDSDFEPYDDYTERDLEELADQAADRYERWLFGED